MTKREKLKLLPAHAEGYGARIEMIPIEANPYPLKSDDYLAWNAGWSRCNYQLGLPVEEKSDNSK